MFYSRLCANCNHRPFQNNTFFAVRVKNQKLNAEIALINYRSGAMMKQLAVHELAISDGKHSKV